jgi:hypothetical protein
MAKKPKTYQLREVTLSEVYEFLELFFEGGKHITDCPAVNDSVLEVRKGKLCILDETENEELDNMMWGWWDLYDLNLPTLATHFIQTFAFEIEAVKAM